LETLYLLEAETQPEISQKMDIGGVQEAGEDSGQAMAEGENEEP
jgi:hypothetical protein